jgi:hypothetical protein
LLRTVKTKFEADHRNSGRKLGVETTNLNFKSLRLESLLLTCCFVVPFIWLSVTSEAQARKHTATTTKKTTTHASATSTTRTGHQLRASSAPATERRHHHTASVTDTPQKNQTKSVNTVHVIRDRHGRIIRRETVVSVEKVTGPHKHHVALQREEKVVTAKEKIEPQSPPENQELPSEYHDFQKAYSLYDEGTNARLAGNYSEAVTHISRALNLVPSNAHGGPSVLVLNMEYDLAQAAEGAGDLPLAARYYARALADRPNFPEASVHLARVLALSGKLDEALRAARDGVARSPNDARTHSMLALLLTKNGQGTEASIESRKAQSLLSSGNSRSYVQPGPGSSPSFKSNTQNSFSGSGIAPASSAGADDDTAGTNKGNSKNPEDEGFMP